MEYFSFHKIHVYVVAAMHVATWEVQNRTESQYQQISFRMKLDIQYHTRPVL